MEQWLKFKLIELPYFDLRTESVLSSIIGRKNRPKIDPFVGGGKVYPDLSKIKVLEWYERDNNLLVLVEGEQKEIDKLLKQESVTYKISPKEVKIEKDGFKSDTFTKDKKIKELSDIGIIPHPPIIDEFKDLNK